MSLEMKSETMFKTIKILPFLFLFFFGSQLFLVAKDKNTNLEAVRYVTLKFLKGSVFAYNLKGEQRQLKKDDKVYFGEILRTSFESIAVVNVIEGVKLKVDANSVVEVDNLYQKASAKKTTDTSFPAFFLHRGTVYGDVDKERKDPRQLKVKSKLVALGVRGTQFFVYIDPEDEKKYSAHVNRGEVQLESDKNKQILGSGQGSFLSGDGEFMEPVEVEWGGELNYNFDPSKGALATSQAVFGKIQEAYEEYAKRTRKKAESYFDSQKKKFDSLPKFKK